jgi:2-phospho-L-lactate guanylyltransferase
LNAAVTLGRDEARRRGFAAVAVVPADLADPVALGAVVAAATGDAVTVVPDRHRDGTNLLVVPTDAAFRFAYGPGSFTAHRAEAGRLGLACAVVLDEALGWDVDTPDDLTRYRELVADPQRSSN